METRTLNWFTKKTAGRGHNSDVYVSVVGETAKDKKVAVAFSFSNEKIKAIGGDFIAFAIDKNRIYFRSAEESEGYKLSKSKDRSTTKATITNEQIMMFKAFAGDYELKRDNAIGFYYIEQ